MPAAPPQERAAAASAAASMLEPCMTCRVTGATTFVGVAAFLVYERARASGRGHRHLLAAMAVSSLGAAALRMYI